MVARRPGEVSGDSARLLDAVAAAAARPVHTLSALTPDATAGLTRATLGRHADDPFCREVWAVTGGNPYDTVELLAKVQDSELQPVEAQAGELRALNRAARGGGLVDRLKGLGLEATRFAWAAAILGTGITVDMVARLATMDDDLARHCAELLCTARILTEPEPALGTERAAGELEFVHPLIATAVYNSIPAGVCTAMHGVAAQIITELGRGAAEAARHLLKVHPDEDDELVEQLREAAREHLAVGAPDAARRCLERALQEPPLPEVHAHVLYELGCATLPDQPRGHHRPSAERPRHARARRGTPGSTPSSASPRRCSTTTSWRRPSARSRPKRPGTRRAPSGCGCRPSSSCGRASTARPSPRPRSRRLADLANTCTGRDNAERALLILRGFDAMTHGESAEEVLELCDRALVNGRLAPRPRLDRPRVGHGAADDARQRVRLRRPARPRREPVRRGPPRLHHGRLARRPPLAGQRLPRTRPTAARAGCATPRPPCARPWSSPNASAAACRCTGRPPADWSTRCWPGAGSRRPGRSPNSTVSHRRTRPPSCCPTSGPCAAGCCSPSAAPRKASTNWRPPRRPPPPRGGHNPVLAPWSIDLAKALAGQDPARAAQLAADARRQAERFGTDTAIGEALRCAAALETGQRAVQLAARAVTYLEASPCQYEHAAARVEYGIAARSVTELNRGLDLARSCGAEGLVAEAREVLETGRGLR